ncbi:MAG: carboxypeptidase-like regulatory domain-containing protein [Enhygromyxa sp.]
MSEARYLRWLALLGLIAVAIVVVWAQDPKAEEAKRSAAPRGLMEPEPAHERAPERGRAWRWPALGESRSIRARIIDSSAGPLSEGRVDLYCLGASYHLSTTVLEEGEFEAPACPEGPTCVRLVHPGVDQPRAWELDAGGEAELEVEAAPMLSGTVVGPEGEAVAGAELLVGLGAARVAASSDAAGEFAVAFPRDRPCDRCDDDHSSCRAEPLASGRERVQVFVSAPKLAPLELELPLGEEPVEIALAPAAPALIGRVIGADEERFDARTRVLATNRAREHERHTAELDAEGRFSFDDLAAAAEYSLRAIRDGREIATLTLARPGEEVELRSKLAARGSTLTLEIAGPDGEPIVGARVDGGPWRAAISDVEGRVEAEAVLPGTYTVRVRAGDSEPLRETIELEPGVGAWARRISLAEALEAAGSR